MTQPADKRRLLRATAPERVGQYGRIIQLHLSSELYEKLYFRAMARENSLADQVRELIEEMAP